MQSILKLELPNGETKEFEGKSFGYVPEQNDNANTFGEVVFQTGMVGYPESLTDPSYRNQILVLTYPLIGNYGVPNLKDTDQSGIPLHTESSQIHVSGLVVNEYTAASRDWDGYKTLEDWLIEHKVVGVSGIDTRELTILLREHGTLKGVISFGESTESTESLQDEANVRFGEFEEFMPDMRNVVESVSIDEPKYYYSTTEEEYKAAPSNDKIHVVAIDCGMKYSQLRLLLTRAPAKHTKVTLVPYNFPFTSLMNDDSTKFDKLFISNGPGNPEDCQKTIQNIQELMKNHPNVPIFGICLGNQLLALAAGAKTYKLKYGNRGHNIPCQLEGTSRCFVTTQNHGFAVDADSLVDGWKPLFTNVNDNSNEGIYHPTRNYFSVQFHPEARAGPQDTVRLFDMFLSKGFDVNTIFDELTNEATPARKERSKVLILGSGGLCIGQSGEFDYSGAQAIKAFREEGLKTILVNPNIATVQTSPDFVDKVYFLPVTPDFVEKVIEKERPDCIALSFGGQTALNCGAQLEQSGILKKYDVKVLGTSVESILLTEDRDLFQKHITSIGESIPEGVIASTMQEARDAVSTLGYPVLIRAAFALGGLGSGFAHNSQELERLLQLAFSNSDQVIIDKSLRGWKEVEYEVMRDRFNNCITICNMENFDPLGVHTGESIVVAPSQTLDDDEYNRLRSVAIKTVSSLNIVGECNIQYALDPDSKKYYIIEINARLSRSSALASKATGYPIAYVAAKLGLGYSLSELKNSITKTTSACFEPSLDYCVVKIPRWDLDKFEMVTTKIDSAMKSVGEGMAISRTFEEALQKAIRITGLSNFGLEPGVVECTDEILKNPTYKRILAIASGMHSGKNSRTS